MDHMTEATATPGSTAKEEAKSHFARAMEEAKAGAQALGKEAQDRAEAYRGKLNERADDLKTEYSSRSGEARDRAYDIATEGKAKASQAISSLGRMIEENAVKLDEQVGPKYGDYARTAARTMQDQASRLEDRTLEELAADAREFVRQSPGLAVGMAAAAGYMVARMFRGR